MSTIADMFLNVMPVEGWIAMTCLFIAWMAAIWFSHSEMEYEDDDE